ncbi:UbiA family prenyltransferase [Nocardioides agariphilus]|jgi:4-hydroxybenzoate polyprenyltransferase|uniref:UbiA family prenyltransferase n=1 Tax=Nocardioides agariphilus TaxID=433664 RepID=A0A930VJR4_9ACTN|nr:UbiA family prenyltransferase [Nocardioides agariphilus]MBF4766906.1 UbiA family prenyltransferase [Nocardioides agariphilus]
MSALADTRPVALVAAAHPGPAAAVTLLAAVLAVAVDMPASRVVLVTAAVAAGQLSIGWSNDLIDLSRDRAVGRQDKPLALGTLDPRVAAAACAAAVVLCVVLSLMCGLPAGLLHLGCVAAGWAYNLGLKATVWSWVPYAVAFGLLPAFVWSAADQTGSVPWWLLSAAASLGVGAHLLNVLPDIADDDATGVRGLPHRLGARRLPGAAVAVLVLGSVLVLFGASVPLVVAVAGVVVVAALAAVVLRGHGKAPFAAAVGIALLDAVLLVVAL